MSARAARVRAAAACAALLAGAVAPAQVPTPQWPGTRPEAQEPQPQQPVQPERQPPFPTVQDRRWRDPLDPTWTSMPRPPEFEGFPVFPSRLSGYGAYPSPAVPGQSPLEQLPGGLSGLLQLPLAPPEAPGWPRWLRLRHREPLPFAPELGLLVQHSDRVWWRATAEDAFVPLFFHDKLRTLRPGAQVEVRQAGEFELLLHTSSRIVAGGPTQLQLVALDEHRVELDARRLTFLRLHVRDREHVLRLPDGSSLQIAARPAEGTSEGPAIVLLQRADEPSRYGGRATMFNAGHRPVRWQFAFGTSELQPGHRLTLFLAPPAHLIGGELEVAGAHAAVGDGGATLSVDGAADARVTWSGASFAVGAGSTLRLHAPQGAPFAAPAEDGKKDTP